LTSCLASYGFAQSLVDPGAFTLFVEKLIYILAMHVDDSILTGKIGKLYIDFKNAFSERFEIEDLGPATCVLDRIIERNRKKRTLRLSQD
jgi:hypothetical protein